MCGNVFVGIDIGTTVLKACALDGRTGAMLGRAARRLKTTAYPNGGSEQNPESLTRAFQAVSRELREQLGTTWSAVGGIGLAAQGGSTIIAGRGTGKPHTPMILWNDGRSRSHAKRIADRMPEDYWRNYALFDLVPPGLGRLLWLKETQPSLFNEDNIHVGAGEYLFFKLTGIWREDAGHAIQIGCYNAVSRQLVPDPFDSIGIPLSFFAPLRQGNETASLSKRGARLLALREGVPVAGPYMDHEGGYLSAVGVSARPLQCSLGTTWVGNFVRPSDVKTESGIQIVLPSPAGEGCLVVLPLLTGNTTWDWGLKTLLAAGHKRALSEASALFSEALLPPEGLVALPWFSQPNPLQEHRLGGGTFFGMNSQTTRADLLRALVAGISFELARVFTGVKESGAIDCVVLSGGASKGAFFRKLIAALFSPLPVLWQRDADYSAARGALYAFSAKAACPETQQVPPPERDLDMAIKRAFQSYHDVFDSLYGTVPIGKPFRFLTPGG